MFIQLFYTAMVALSVALVAYVTAVTTWTYGREDRAVGGWTLVFLVVIPMVLALALNILGVVGLLEAIAPDVGVEGSDSAIQEVVRWLYAHINVALRSRDLLVLNTYSLAAPLMLAIAWVFERTFLNWIDGQRRTSG